MMSSVVKASLDARAGMLADKANIAMKIRILRIMFAAMDFTPIYAEFRSRPCKLVQSNTGM